MAVNQNFKESTVSTSNHTQNYDLPLWTEGDKTSWLTQVNDAMNKIDSGMVDAKSKALEVVGIAADAKKLAEETSAESKESAKIVAGYNDRLTAVEATSVEHTNDITALNTRCDQMDVEIHSVKETQKKTTEDLGTLADQVKHNKEDADTTKQSVSVLNGNVVELTGRITTCEDDIEALKVTTAANTKNIAQAEENVATVTGKVTALETEVGEVSSATQSNTTAISAINTSIESIKSKDTAQDEKIAANSTEISSLDGRVTALEDGGGSGSVAIVKTKKYSNISNGGMELYTRNDNTAQILGLNSTILVNEYSDGTLYIDAILTNASSTTPSLSTIDRAHINVPNTEIIKDFPILNKNYITIGSGNLHVQTGSYPNIKDSYYTATCRNFDASSANVIADIYNEPMTVSAGGNNITYAISMMLREVNLNDSE